MNRLALSTIAIAALASPVFAGDPPPSAFFQLSDRNAAAGIDLSLGAGSGMTSWVVDDVNRLNLQGFWYRTPGMESESNIANLFRVGAFLSDTNPFVDDNFDTLAVRYEGPQRSYFIDTTWTLRGGAFGSSVSSIAETIRITNNNLQAPLTISFFQYSDFDLSGGVRGQPFPDQSVVIANGDLHNQANQFGSDIYASETIVTPGPTHYEVGFAGPLLASLNDGLVTTLADIAGPIGPGNLAWAFQWDFIIAPGQSVLISKNKSFVPAPGATALLGLGGLLAARRRRA